ncbi:MAG: hypothetical protein ACJA13_001327 [Paraglaciecola sp.]|jgi:hypothetical protein
MKKKIIDLLKEWVSENIIFVILMVLMFAAMQYLIGQERAALGKAAQQVEVLKLKISMTMEQ